MSVAWSTIDMQSFRLKSSVVFSCPFTAHGEYSGNGYKDILARGHIVIAVHHVTISELRDRRNRCLTRDDGVDGDDDVNGVWSVWTAVEDKEQKLTSQPVLSDNVTTFIMRHSLALRSLIPAHILILIVIINGSLAGI